MPLLPPFPDPEGFHLARISSVEVRARAIEGVDRYWELFDDDLPDIGIGAVWVIVRNIGPSEINLEEVKVELHFGGRNSRSLSPDEMLNLFYRRRSVRFYSANLHGKARMALRSVSFKRPRIGPEKEHAGFLFFRIALRSTSQWTQGTRLVLRDIRLANKEKTSIELPLAYANP